MQRLCLSPKSMRAFVKLTPSLNKMNSPYHIYKKFVRGVYINSKKKASTSLTKYAELFLRSRKELSFLDERGVLSEFKEKVRIFSFLE